ncbi:MAG: T9SS type A sorting domain-containing protein [Bacteroidetes bacterium]|nr:T9SS type A sorting domain-containing protein [Bacteroidota bacterium]
MNKQFLLLGSFVSIFFQFFTFDSSAQILDTNMWVTNGPVYSIAVDSNYTYVGGEFNYIGPCTGAGAKISTTDDSFQNGYPKVNGLIWAVASDGNGGWYIGGVFTKVGSYQRNRIAHINADKTVDASWDPNVKDSVNSCCIYSIMVNGNDVYVGGVFSSIGVFPISCVAKLNNTTGAADEFWNPNPNYVVTSIVKDGNDIYIGGGFTSIGGQTRNNVAKLNSITGEVDSIWNPNADSYVNSIAISGNSIYVGGGFIFVGGYLRNHIAKLNKTDGMADTIWNPNANNAVMSIVVNGIDIYIGGAFDYVGGITRNKIAKLDNITGAVDTIWNPNADNYVNSIAIEGSDIYAVGGYRNIGGQPRNFVSKLNNITGAADLTWNPNASDRVLAIAISGSDIFLGGDFKSIGGLIRTGIAKLNNITGAADPIWNPNAYNLCGNPYYRSIVISGNDIYAGGNFYYIGGQLRNGIAKLNKFNGLADTIWNPNPSDSVFGGSSLEINSIAIKGSDIYVGGDFTKIGGQLRNNIAKLNNTNGEADVTWNPNTDTFVCTFAINGSNIYVGGDFWNIGNQARVVLAKLNCSNGVVDSIWNAHFVHNASYKIYSIAINGSDIYVGGSFATLNGHTRNNIAKLNEVSGAVDPTWNPNINGIVRSILINGDDIYVGGYFNYIGGYASNGIAKLNNYDGAADPYWILNSNNITNVNSIVISGSDFYVGGDFNSIAAGYSPNFAKFLYFTASAEGIPSTIARSLSIYPNPANNLITIETPVEGKTGTIIILNVNGQKLITKQLTTFKSEIDVSDLPSGIYFVRVINKKSESFGKFIKN